MVLSLQVTDTPGLLKRPDGNDILYVIFFKIICLSLLLMQFAISVRQCKSTQVPP